MGSCIAILTCAAALIMAGNTSGTPLSPGSGPVNDVFLNYDFTGVYPAPPYMWSVVYSDFASVNGSEVVTIDVFGDLFGAGPLLASFDEYTNSNHRGFTNPEVLDGLFSVGYRSKLGIATLLGGATLATAPSGEQERIQGVLVDSVATVPEPATFALLGLGLIGIAASRRRRAS